MHHLTELELGNVEKGKGGKCECEGLSVCVKNGVWVWMGLDGWAWNIMHYLLLLIFLILEFFFCSSTPIPMSMLFTLCF